MPLNLLMKIMIVLLLVLGTLSLQALAVKVEEVCSEVPDEGNIKKFSDKTDSAMKRLVIEIKKEIKKIGKKDEDKDGPWPSCMLCLTPPLEAPLNDSTSIQLAAQECKDYIQKYDKKFKIYLCPPNYSVTMPRQCLLRNVDFNRVKIWHDENFNVISVPSRG